MNIQPYYITLADYGDLGLGHACDPADFSDACDAYSERRTEGNDAAVFRVDPPKNGDAGMMTDVTADADARISRLCSYRNENLPDWMREAVQ